MKEIKAAANAGDDEVAHVLEKQLWEDVLVYLSGMTNHGLIEKVLSSRDIEFSRWFA